MKADRSVGRRRDSRRAALPPQTFLDVLQGCGSAFLPFRYLRASRKLAGNPDSPQAVIFLASITDVMMGS